MTLRDDASGEFHRADVLCRHPDGRTVVLELQHSSISEEERESRERFYSQGRSMFWLLHIHDSPGSFRGWSFAISLDFSDKIVFHGRTFGKMKWMGRSSQFIERWKRSCAHVFLQHGARIFYLATAAACRPLVDAQNKGEFALCEVTTGQFVEAVRGAA